MAGDPRPARGLLYSTAAMVAALGHAPSKLRALHWEATVSVPGVWIGAYFVELFCWATAAVENGPQKLVCIDILASLSCAFELLGTVLRESGN